MSLNEKITSTFFIHEHFNLHNSMHIYACMYIYKRMFIVFQCLYIYCFNPRNKTYIYVALFINFGHSREINNDLTGINMNDTNE